MASKSAQQEPEKAEVIEEALDVLDKALDRVKVLYEQYFLGIQKQAPSFLHTDVERKLRDLSQMQIRNTALRYRLTTLQQKYGAYTTYWRRTIKQIENGTYARNLSKVGRRAVRTGEAVPEEILAAMPKRMREQVVRDRDLALAIASRRRGDGEFEEEVGTTPFVTDDMIAMISEPTDLRRKLHPTVHQLDDVDIDLNDFFAEVERQTPASESAPEPVNVTFKSGGTSQLFGGDAGKTVDARSALETAATVWGDAAAVVPEPGRAPTVPVRSPADLVPEAGRAPTVPVRSPDLAGAARTGAATPTVPTAAVPRPPVARPAPTTIAAPRADDSGPRAMPAIPKLPAIPTAPSQLTKPNPIAPGAAATRAATPVETMAGPFPRVGPRPGVPEPAAREPSGRASGVPEPVGREPSAATRAAPRASDPSAATRAPSRAPEPSAATRAPNAPIRPSDASAAARGAPNAPSRAPDPRAAKTPSPPDATNREPPTAAARSAMLGPPPGARGPTLARPAPVVPADVDSGWGDSDSTSPRVAGPRPEAPAPRSPTAEPARPEPRADSPRPRVERKPRPAADAPRLSPPPGMTDADVNALFANYVKAKEMVGESAGPGSYGKLLKTINAQAPKIMQQYNAKGVDFSIVVKDNQVIIRAKPKT